MTRRTSFFSATFKLIYIFEYVKYVLWTTHILPRTVLNSLFILITVESASLADLIADLDSTAPKGKVPEEKHITFSAWC